MKEFRSKGKRKMVRVWRLEQKRRAVVRTSDVAGGEVWNTIGESLSRQAHSVWASFWRGRNIICFVPFCFVFVITILIHLMSG